MRSSTVLALMCLLACATVVASRRVAPRPHGDAHLARKAPRHAAHRAASAKATIGEKYSPIMAYHEEPDRPPRPLWEAQWVRSAAGDIQATRNGAAAKTNGSPHVPCCHICILCLASCLSQDIEDFHTNGNYDTEMTGVVNNAMLYASASTPTNNSAWVFDIDETSLSGYSEMLSIGFGYVPKLSHAWILNSSAPAIPQTLALYNQLISSGFRVIFLTGRHNDEADATALNLKNAGYVGYDTLITRTAAESNLTAAVYKTNRRIQLSEVEGYDIVGCIGDQWSDLHGVYTGFKVKLPNYIYYLP